MKRRSFVGALAAAAAAQNAPAGYYAIRNATIHPVSGPSIANGTLIVRNGLIESLGPDAPAPAGAWTIDGKGCHVYPGFIDALSKWGLPTAAPAAPSRGAAAAAPPGGRRTGDATPNIQFLDDGGPEDRPSNTSWVQAADLVDPREATIGAARGAGYSTAIVFPSTGIFAGQGSAMNLAGERAGEMVVASPVAQYLSVATRGSGSYPGSLLGAFAYIRQVYLDAAHYKAAKAMYSTNPRGIQRPAYDRALEGVLASPRILLPASRMVEMDRMIRFGKELGVPYVLYGGTEAWRSAALLKKSGSPILLDLKWPERDREADPEAMDSLRTLEAREMAPSGAAALHKEGVHFAFYSGGVGGPNEIRVAVKKAVSAGLPADEAIRALTWNAAKIYGLEDRLGSIEPGKIANLLITSGEWLDDRSRVRMVFVDGKKFEPAPTPAAAGREA